MTQSAITGSDGEVIGGSLQMENIVVSTEVGQELDLQELALDLSNAQYDEEQFPGIVYRLDEPRATALIFRSGKLVCTGAKSLEDAETAVNAVFEEMEEMGIQIGDPEIHTQNIVSSGDFEANLNLNAIAIGLGLEHVEYEPEQFPGLVYRLDDPDVVVLLFGSGRTVITGATQPDEVGEAFKLVESDLEELGLLTV